MPRLFARCLRGIEWVAAAELQAGFGAMVTGRGHRELRLETTGPPAALLGARTVDDLFVQAGTVAGVDRTRASLARLAAGVDELDLPAAVEVVGGVRPLPRQPGSEVSASFLGRRNYSRYDVEDAAGGSIARRLGAPYRSRRTSAPAGAPLAWRVHLAGDQALVGLRLADRPLHRRGYKLRSRPGTLHPPLAAAMALVAGLRPEATLLDPFCGVGTVPIEAAGLRPGRGRVGSDVSPPAVAAAAANAADAGVAAAFVVADAGSLPFAAGQVDRVVTNPPWRRQVGPAGGADPGGRRAWSELARVMSPAARMVALVEDPEETLAAGAAAGLRLQLLDRVSLFGRHPALVLAWPRDAAARLVDAEGLYGPALAAQLAADDAVSPPRPGPGPRPG
jgi:tRNA (guanine6-N2)-methyltransferase